MKQFTGIVVSKKMNKTVIVEVLGKRRHPVYGRSTIRKSRLKAHNENDMIKEGESVTIKETRPLSKSKQYIVINTK